MEPVSIVILALAGLIAVSTLARLMLRRRDQIVAELQAQAEQEAARKKAEESRRRQRARRAG